MGFDIMKEIKGLCKGCIDDEDWCIFIVAAILGFLLCMYIGKEPFIAKLFDIRVSNAG